MNLGFVLAGIYLILNYLLPLLGINLPYAVFIYPILAAVAGVVLLAQGGWLAYRLFGLWLLLVGALALLSVEFKLQSLLMGLLALVVGVMLLASGLPRVRRMVGTRLTGVWLMIVAAFSLLSLSFAYSNLITAILAIAAGALLVARR